MCQWEYCEILEIMDPMDDASTSSVTLIYVDRGSEQGESVADFFVALYDEGWELAEVSQVQWRAWKYRTKKYLFKRLAQEYRFRPEY